MDRLHFLNTGASDCIIIESDGHFAMVDAGEDTDYPADKPHLKYRGYEDTVVEYLLKNCRAADGRVCLDFIVGTHAHSDHLGGFDTVILHPDITVKKAYLKPYDETRVNSFERTRWDNLQVYEQMYNALKERGVPIAESFENECVGLGALTVTLLNGAVKRRPVKLGENVNSVVTLIEKNGTRALLMGDLNYKGGGEYGIAKRVGRVDLLKVGHHGNIASTSFALAKRTAPKYAVITGGGIFPDVRFKLKHIAKSEILFTVKENGIIAEIGDNGRITIKKNIM